LAELNIAKLCWQLLLQGGNALPSFLVFPVGILFLPFG
jgi:hypothetical protein